MAGVDYRTKDEVVRAAIAFREKHNALDWSADIDALIRLDGLDQGSYGGAWGSWGSAFRRLTTGVAKKVLALISVKERVILVSDELSSARRPFAKAHELGHSVLPWHNEILYVCDEGDLSPATRAQMEFEANTFAGSILLPPPLVSKVHAEHPIDMQTVKELADRSGASMDASANAYMEGHPGKCALVRLEPKVGEDGVTRLVLKQKHLSAAAVRAPMGQLTNGQLFGPGHVLWERSRMQYTVLPAGLHFKSDPAKQYRVSLFNNGYRVLALIIDDAP